MEIEFIVSGVTIGKGMLLQRFGSKVIPAYEKGVDRAGSQYRDFIKRMRPVSAKTTGYGAKGIPVDTGRMRAAMKKRKIQQLAVGVGPKVNYGVYVHEGTSKMEARPFMEWALDLGARRMIDNELKNVSSSLRV